MAKKKKAGNSAEVETTSSPLGVTTTVTISQTPGTKPIGSSSANIPNSSSSRGNDPEALSKKNIDQRFGDYFGENTLENWQRLCVDLGLVGDFSSKTKCRKAIKKINVNIYDFLKAVKEGIFPYHFPNVTELRRYTIKNKKIFPKKKAKEEKGPVRALLKGIFFFPGRHKRVS
ncbi:hypothetical protein B0H66DRAFT_9932 [Apodospora peruviana]|uniref:Uncharacterized protein n=1 Tax=Apodospora peruviana TaxID=516989 RepID=A0AAE0IPM8_9PEZI|nr:hypothetical protein B0H66DRAFT_9932 [Apodospora peruviana]